MSKSKRVHYPKLISKDLSEFVKSYFGKEYINPISFNAAASKYIANDLAFYPAMLAYYKKKYIELVKFSTEPTEDFDRAININDIGYTIKRLSNVPVKEFQTDQESWLLLSKYQREGKIKIVYHTEQFEETLKKEMFANFTYNEKDKKKEKKKKSKDDISKIYTKWEGYQRQIIHQAVQKISEKAAIDLIDEQYCKEAIQKIESICIGKFNELVTRNYLSTKDTRLMSLYYYDNTDVVGYFLDKPNADEMKKKSEEKTKLTEFSTSKDAHLETLSTVIEENEVNCISILMSSVQAKDLVKSLKEKCPTQRIIEIPFDNMMKALMRKSTNVIAGIEDSQISQDDKEICQEILNVEEML